MILSERHNISKSHVDYKSCDNLCFLSKNLYNTALYTIKQEYLSSGRILRYHDLDKLFKKTNQSDYRALTNNTAQQILIILDKNIKSYFSLLKKWKKDKKSLSGCPKFPKYKDKTKGRNLAIFTYIQVSYKDGYIHFPKKTNLSPLKTKVKKEDIKQIRIIPQSSCYVIEVCHDYNENKLLVNDNIAAIDLGVNNLAALTFNNSKHNYLINGKPLKSINQFYNKKKGVIQTELKKKHDTLNSNRLNKLINKRNNKINDYLHKSSKKIIDLLIEKEVSQLVIGYNKLWKQEINLGRKINQAFCSIPYYRFIEQLKYKCQKEGISILINEESYTSKCSSLDLEPIMKQENYLGKREKRGMFRSSSGIKINADINGSLNIGRKVFGDEYVKTYQTNRGYAYYPVKLKI